MQPNPSKKWPPPTHRQSRPLNQTYLFATGTTTRRGTSRLGIQVLADRLKPIVRRTHVAELISTFVRLGLAALLDGVHKLPRVLVPLCAVRFHLLSAGVRLEIVLEILPGNRNLVTVQLVALIVLFGRRRLHLPEVRLVDVVEVIQVHEGHLLLVVLTKGEDFALRVARLAVHGQRHQVHVIRELSLGAVLPPTKEARDCRHDDDHRNDARPNLARLAPRPLCRLGRLLRPFLLILCHENPHRFIVILSLVSNIPHQGAGG